MDAVKDQLKTIRAKLDQVPALHTAEEKTNVPKEYLVIGGGFFLFFLVFFGIGAGSLCSIVGFVYPAFKSFEAIEKKTRGDDTQWLIYWVVYAFFSIIEVFTSVLLYWIPFYYAFKLAFLLWAMLPQTKGAKFLYDTFLKDFLKKNESRIDAALNEAKKSAGTVASEAAAATADLSASGISAAASYAAKNSSSEVEKEETDKKDD
mmetsp:Transcript_11178/g.33109  ORF Transcript_11178/g.33109 Transcript_11178/m.33109 type:complete len:205 (-) Transcript_11178:584-1198(-)|eukprot:CAMPEP_0113546090 /NCGR_PEP_ID=MMETSP0015_2-20120614/11617_1 /TAXON_ID=2838 /ORGANISM="Odontella" /LENGTH=204 /DNA_ID=CAMNT_0000446515 /DNA_START=87 /DNA_END=701 /DNA_ORIENTATION=+ /assembly_acc=CAM_ASM_000160